MPSWWKHIALVISNGLRTVLVGLGNLAIAWLVVRQSSTLNWGDFVPYLVGMSLVTMVLGWGNRELLLRRFSMEHTPNRQLYYQSIFTRLLLVLPLLPLVLFAVGSDATSGWGICWLLAVFGYQSHDAWLTFYKKFSAGLLAECVGFGSILGALAYQPSLADVPGLIQLYAISFLLRLLVVWMLVRPPKWPKVSWQPINWSLLQTAFPFLLIGVVGLLSTKMDLYVVSFSLEPSESGTYQILTGGLTFIRAAAGIIVYTFIADVYRLKKAKFNVYIKRLGSLGLLICILGVIALGVLLKYGFDLQFDYLIYVAAIFYCWPAYWITLHIMYLYQQQQEQLVIRAGILVAGLNLVLSLILLPTLGILGGLIAGALSSTAAALIYRLAFNRR